MHKGRLLRCCVGAALGLFGTSVIGAAAVEARRVSPRQVRPLPAATAWKLRVAPQVGQRWAVRNSALQGKGNPSYFDYAKSPAISAEVRRMEGVLNQRATPGFNVFVFSKPGVQVRASGDHMRIGSGGKACTVDAVAVLPTSGHVPGQTAQQLAKDQRHTVWHVAGRPNPGDRSNTLIDGAQSNGKLVTVVKFKMPLQPGDNFLYFDPYPGRTASVGGFSGGRTQRFVVE